VVELEPGQRAVRVHGLGGQGQPPCVVVVPDVGGHRVRWRTDRDPRSCGFDQLEEPVGFNLADILAQ